jgi:hypothetical protein
MWPWRCARSAEYSREARDNPGEQRELLAEDPVAGHHLVGAGLGLRRGRVHAGSPGTSCWPPGWRRPRSLRWPPSGLATTPPAPDAPSLVSAPDRGMLALRFAGRPGPGGFSFPTGSSAGTPTSRPWIEIPPPNKGPAATPNEGDLRATVLTFTRQGDRQIFGRDYFLPEKGKATRRSPARPRAWVSIQKHV